MNTTGLDNCTIVRVDKVAGAPAPMARRRPFVDGDPIAARCTAHAPTARQQVTLDTVSKDVRLVVGVRVDALPPGTRFGVEDRVIVRLDSTDAESTWVIRRAEEFAGGSLANWQLALAPAAGEGGGA